MGANILGISAYYHDSACCLFIDGQLMHAASEERFTRKKYDCSFPERSIQYCLDASGLTISQIDCVAFYEDPKKKLSRQLWMGMNVDVECGMTLSIAEHVSAIGKEQRDLRAFGYHGPIHYVEHHQAHAASSYYMSGFQDAALFTVDGVGEWATTTYGRGQGSKIELFEEVSFPHSLGFLYSAITAFLGFEVNDSEYKVMGLAPYGEPHYVEHIWKLITLGKCGSFRLSMEYFDFLRTNQMYSPALTDLLGKAPRKPDDDIEDFHRDIARSVQVVLEETLLSKVRYLHEVVPSRNLCMAGGVALNCVANGRIQREGPFENVFVQPAAGDGGACIGAAALAHVSITGEHPRQERIPHVYLGPRFDSNDIRHDLENSAATFEDFSGKTHKLLNAVCERLESGKVIGWFHGGMEFGPRALGARSILADPRNPEMRDRVNALVKKREGFRPFAPSVIAELAPQHFQMGHPSPFMLETCQVISSLPLPAITHIDGSARVQTVHREHSARYYSLLQTFYERTGCPMLLNTSFNMKGEPIVCTPVDAILCFLRAGIDTLVLEDFLLDQDGVPLTWRFAASLIPMIPSSISKSVYTML